MGTTADKLTYLQGTKVAIHDAIVAKGVSIPVGTPFRDYATKISTISGGSSLAVADTWVRPSEWLALPNNIDGVEKVSILNAVFDTDSELVSFTCSGNYTVDWGDGTVENYIDGVKAEHKYNYSNINLNTDTVTKFGYKQCIITITPQSGQNLTSVNFNSYHSSIGSGTSYDLASGFLDIRFNSISCTSFTLGAVSDYLRHTRLEQCLIGELADTSLQYHFNSCYSLQSVSFKNTINIVSFQATFQNCYSLQKVPNIVFSNNCNVGSMFNNCYSLYEVPKINLSISAGSYLIGMFSGCYSLPYIDISINSGVDFSMANMFYNCKSLENINLSFSGVGKITALTSTFAYTRIKTAPNLDTSLCTDFSNCFQNCEKLVTVPQYNYSSATLLSYMFNLCSSIKIRYSFNTTGSLTNVSNMFAGCTSLELGATFDNLMGVTDFSNMYNACSSLSYVPKYTINFPTTIGSMFSGCSSLQIAHINNLQSLGSTTNTQMLLNCFSLKRMLIPLRNTFTVTNAKMSASALNEMYNILPAVTGQTVTVTGNYGVTGDDPSIATAKGWTVIG